MTVAARFRANGPPAVEKSDGRETESLSSPSPSSSSTWSRRDRGGTLCKSSAEVYQHQRHPALLVAPVRSRRRRVVVLLLRFTLLRTFPRDDPLCVLLATENASHLTTTMTTTTTSTLSDSPRFILSLSWSSLFLSLSSLFSFASSSSSTSYRPASSTVVPFFVYFC